MMKKPQALRPGDRISIVNVAAPEPAAEPDRFERGLEYLRKRGYNVDVAPHARGRRGYLAATERDLADDLHAAVQNPEVRAVITAGGGTNANRLLRHLDYELFAATPKIIVGVSNPTVLLNAITARANVVTFHGPTVVWNFGDPEGVPTVTEESFWNALTSDEPRVFPANAARAWLGEGAAEGPLVGGNLISLEGLLGTRHEPEWTGAILFWEDIAKPMNRLDMMLTHFRDAGVFDKIAGMVVGSLVSCTPEAGWDLPDMLRDVLGPRSIPVLTNVPLGHTAEKYTLPIGCRARLDASTNTFSMLEGGVEGR